MCVCNNKIMFKSNILFVTLNFIYYFIHYEGLLSVKSLWFTFGLFCTFAYYLIISWDQWCITSVEHDTLSALCDTVYIVYNFVQQWFSDM